MQITVKNDSGSVNINYVNGTFNLQITDCNQQTCQFTMTEEEEIKRLITTMNVLDTHTTLESIDGILAFGVTAKYILTLCHISVQLTQLNLLALQDFTLNLKTGNAINASQKSNYLSV